MSNAITAREFPTAEDQTELVETLEAVMSYFQFGEPVSAHEIATGPQSMPNVANRRSIDFPAANLYDSLSPDQVKALCEIDIPGNQMNRIMPPWNSMSILCQRFFRIKAYWALRGSEYPTISAFLHIEAESPFAENSRVELTANGWVPKAQWRPTTLRELEEKFLPKQAPNIHRIIQRCPQMAMIHALRGDVSEPYWWAALAITENATPNLSREFSDGYPKFSEDELAQRVARIHSEKKRPALCDRIDSVNRNVCAVCRFRGSINSPIALGFEHEPKRKAIAP